MKPSSPLLPPDSFLGRPTKRNQPSVKLMIFVVIGIHVVVIGGLLFQGCHHKAEAESAVSPVVTNALSTVPTASASNPIPAKTYTAVAPELARAPVVAYAAQRDGAPTTAQAFRDYRVVSGDTLSKIAARHHVRAASLLEANHGLSATYLRVGQLIHVPANSEAVAQDFAGRAGGASEEIYVIKSGDRLEKIAKAHGTTVKTLQRLNNLSSDRLVVGKQLKIPFTLRKETETPLR